MGCWHCVSQILVTLDPLLKPKCHVLSDKALARDTEGPARVFGGLQDEQVLQSFCLGYQC